MAQNPQENTPQPGTPAFSQDDIDALLQDGGGATPAGDAESAAPAGDAGAEAAAPDRGSSQEVDQSDIDALFGGGSSAAPAGESGSEPAPASAEAGDSGAVDQAAIDALLAGGGGGDEAPSAEQPAVAAEAAAEPDSRVDSMGRPFDEMAAAMAAAIEEEQGQAPAPAPAPLALEEFSEGFPEQIDSKRVSMLNDVSLRVKIELGRTRMLVEEVLKLDVGSVVELERLAGDPVDVYVNDRLIARGEVLVLNDNFCVRVSEVNSEDPHRVST